MTDAKLRASERLRSAADFRRIFRKGIRLDGPLFVLLVAENKLDVGRLGLAVGRRVGGAVQRNRAKRLLRDIFRRNKGEAILGLDLVLIPKPEIGGRTRTDVEREYRARLKKLAQRRGHGTHPTRPD